jgi:transcription initiation factor TFIID TATA-box-binding protein
MVVITVVNVVASASVGVELDLQEISSQLDEIEYDPDRFPGAICRVKEPKTAILFFRSGKIVCTGARSLENVRLAIDMMMKRLRALGIMVDESPEITVQNIVATTDLGTDLKLNVIAISLGLEKVEYEPEQFPGLVYRVESPKVVALLFSSGKVVCTGAKKISDIELAVNSIIEELKSAGFL